MQLNRTPPSRSAKSIKTENTTALALSETETKIQPITPTSKNPVETLNTDSDGESEDLPPQVVLPPDGRPPINQVYVTIGSDEPLPTITFRAPLMLEDLITAYDNDTAQFDFNKLARHIQTEHGADLQNGWMIAWCQARSFTIQSMNSDATLRAAIYGQYRYWRGSASSQVAFCFTQAAAATPVGKLPSAILFSCHSLICSSFFPV